MQFKSPHFKFNGRSSKEFQLRICQIGSSSTNPIFGATRTLEKDTSSNWVHPLKKISYTDATMDITLIKTDGNIPLPITDDEKFEIISWLFQDDFKPFISEDDENKIYYAMFTGGSSYQNALKQGYLTLNMQLNAPCAFSPINTGFFKVEGDYYLDLTNRTNLGTYTEPDIELQLTGDTTSIRIENLSTGDVMSFEGLPKGSHIKCYNESMKQLLCVNDPNLNLRPFMKDKTWIRLAKGINRLRITSDSATVAIVGQSRIALS